MLPGHRVRKTFLQSAMAQKFVVFRTILKQRRLTHSGLMFATEKFRVGILH